MKTPDQRLFQRGKKQSFYADYRDLGGKFGEACKVHPDDRSATTDYQTALGIVEARIIELTSLRDSRRTFTPKQRMMWRELEEQNVYARFKLWRLAGHGGHKRGNIAITEREVDQMVKRIKRAAAFFDKLMPQETGRTEVLAYKAHLFETLEAMDGGPAKGGTVSNYLNTLSNFFLFMDVHGMVTEGFNPYRTLPTSEKPKAGEVDDSFFEHHHAAAILAAARVYEHNYPTRPGYYGDQTYPLLACLLLTGGRLTEIRGIEWGDFDFRRDVVYLIENQYRNTKTRKPREVPLWGQLKDILLEYRESCDPKTKLLFPPIAETMDGMRTPGSIYDSFDDVAKFMGWPDQWDVMRFEPAKIRPHRLRHTYTAVRLQTTDQGTPVSQFTVQSELGHSDWSTTQKIYARLGRNFRRYDEVRYVMEDFRGDEWLEDKAKEFMLRIA